MFPAFINAQSKSSIKVITRTLKDEITLRWAATDPVCWENCNKYGFTVEKIILARNGKILEKPERIILTESPVKPKPLNEWETIAKSDKFGAIGAQAIYGKTFQLNQKSTDMIQMINKAKETESRFSFALFCADQSSEVAKMMGLQYADKNIKAGEKYLYKVYSQVPATILKVDTGFVFVEADKLAVLPTPVSFKTEFGDKSAMLSWNKIYQQDIYSSYIIERSDDDGKTFKSINDNPFISTNPDLTSNPEMMYYLDSLPLNDKKYIYRIKGKTYFGDIGPNSEATTGMGIAIPTAIPAIISGTVVNNKSIHLKWRFPENQKHKIKGFKIYKAEKVNGTYKEISEGIIGKDVNEFLFTKPSQVNYLEIRAVDAKAQEYASMPYLVQLEDNTPPIKPQGLKATMDSTGTVILRWKKNSEADLLGYRVYMANSKNDEFTQITQSPVIDSIFKTSVTLNTLSKNIYYKIMALDNHFNRSSFSDIVILRRIDTIAPAPPVFSNYYISDSSVSLEWASAFGDDIEKYSILRRESENAKWIKIGEIKADQKNVFSDNKLKSGIEYQYSIIAIDDSKNQSPISQPLKATLVKKGIKPSVENFRAEIDRVNKHINLSWDYQQDNISEFQIYKAEGENLLRLYKSIEANIYKYADSNLLINRKYKYSIRVKFKDGSSTPLSKEVIVSY